MRNQVSSIIRPLYILDVAEKVCKKTDIASTGKLDWVFEVDINPIDLQLRLPVQLHNILHQAYIKSIENRSN